MDKKIVNEFKFRSSSCSSFANLFSELEQKYNVVFSEMDRMFLVAETEAFAKQLSYAETTGNTTILKEESLLAPTMWSCSAGNGLLRLIAMTIVGSMEQREEDKQKELIDNIRYNWTSPKSFLSSMRTWKVNKEEASEFIATLFVALAEKDVLFKLCLLSLGKNVDMRDIYLNKSVYQPRMLYFNKGNNDFFGYAGPIAKAYGIAKEVVTNKIIEEEGDDNMKKIFNTISEIRAFARKNKEALGKENYNEIMNIVEETNEGTLELEEAEACVCELALSSGVVPEIEQTPVQTTTPVPTPVEQINALADTDEEAVSVAEEFGVDIEVKEDAKSEVETPSDVTETVIEKTQVVDPLIAEIKEQRKKVARQGNFTDGAESMEVTGTTDASFTDFVNGAILDAQIKIIQHSEDVATLSKELQSIGVTVEGIALDMEQGLHKMKVGDTRYAVSNTKKRIQANLDAFYSRIEKVLDKPKYCFPRNGWLQPCGEYVSFCTLNKISNKATIKVAQIPSRKERVAKQVAEPVAPTQVSTQTVTPVQTTPVATTVVKTVPVQTTASKGVPTPKNPKGGNGAKRDVRIQVRATGDRYVGYVAVAKLSTKAGEKVVSKTIKAEGDHIANALWNVLADALDAVDKNKVGRVFIDVPDIFVKAINTHKNGFKKFKWAREEALRFADARDEFAINQLAFRTNGGCGFKTDAAFVTPSPSTRKEVGVAPTVRE